MRKSTAAVTIVKNHITACIKFRLQCRLLRGTLCLESWKVLFDGISTDSRSSVRQLFSSSALRQASFATAKACRAESSSDSAFSRPPSVVVRAHWTQDSSNSTCARSLPTASVSNRAITVSCQVASLSTSARAALSSTSLASSSQR